MGIVFRRGIVGSSYIKKPKCQKPISHHQTVRGLTRQNIQFLKSLGLKLRQKK